VRISPGITLVAAPNGAGKTTLLRLCAGIMRPMSGRVRVLAEDPYARSAIRARIGYLSHQAGLDPCLTVADNLEFWARMRGYRGRQGRQVVTGVVEQLDLGSLASSPAGSLSRGQRQRAALARALLGQPDVLLLDEPATGLDPGWHDKLTRILEGKVRGNGACVLLASHDPRDHATGWKVLEITDGVVHHRRRDHGPAVARYQVEVASPVRITRRGPWEIEYADNDPVAMTVTLTAHGALAAFVSALEQASVTVVSIQLRTGSQAHRHGAGHARGQTERVTGDGRA
jgi:ABC-type transport system involved in cytochrome c biogenesis ATPase subunit